MVKENSSSPEKQLLGLIEEPEKTVKQETAVKTGDSSSVPPGSPKKTGSPEKSGSVEEKVMPAPGTKKPYLKKLPFKGVSLNIKDANKALKLCAGALGIYLGVSFVIAEVNLKRIPRLAMEVKAGAEYKSQEPASLLKEAFYYLNKVKARNIFKPLSIKPKTETGTESLPAVELSKVIKELKLVGISYGKDPQAMIADTVTNRTNFYRPGDKILGKAKVITISKEKVVVMYEGKELPLR